MRRVLLAGLAVALGDGLLLGTAMALGWSVLAVLAIAFGMAGTLWVTMATPPPRAKAPAVGTVTLGLPLRDATVDVETALGAGVHMLDEDETEAGAAVGRPTPVAA